MSEWLIFFSMLTLGLVSSTHCIGMCGGIMGALAMAIPANAARRRWGILVAYNLGRVTSYSLIGFLAGIFTQQLGAAGNGSLLRIMAGLLLIGTGLYLADWWRGLLLLEKIGRHFWVHLQPLGKNLLPVNNAPKAFLLGTIWGWLPCGLVYSALALAITQPAPLLAAGSMLAFGLGTFPAVLAASVAMQQLSRFLQQRKIRIALGLLVILFGFWTIYGGVNLSGMDTHHHHANNMADT